MDEQTLSAVNDIYQEGKRDGAEQERREIIEAIKSLYPVIDRDVVVDLIEQRSSRREVMGIGEVFKQGKKEGAAQERREIMMLARELAADGIKTDPITGTLYQSYSPWFYQLSNAIAQRSHGNADDATEHTERENRKDA